MALNIMKSTKKLSFLILIILIPALLISINVSIKAAAGESQIIQDLSGRKVKVPSQIDRIAAVGPGTLRQVLYIDGIKRIVGVEQQEKTENWYPSYNIAYPELKKLPVIGPQHGGDAELILAQKPQVIFFRGDSGGAKTLKSKTGIPVINIRLGDFYKNRDTLYQAWKVIGKTLNKDKRANNLINYTKKLIEDLKQRTKNINSEKKPEVFAGGIAHHGGKGLPSTKFPFPPFKFVNALNTAEDDLNYQNVTSIIVNREKLLSWNPDLIFIDAFNLNLVKQDLKQHPEYENIKAVKNNKIYSLLPYSLYNRNQENILVNSYFIGKTIYPKAFKDINIKAKADKIFTEFLGKSIYDKLQKKYIFFEKLD
uniref:Periplasmic binding protein n=1 Tax=uncultured organism TaxID=155900 RepID=M1Q293_9ZZZZ|nr:periplasmic binding protein [uncultured organism]